MPKPRLELTGQKFGMLTVLGFSHITRDGKTSWRCRCDCGNETSVRGSELQCGKAKACGCQMGNHGPRAGLAFRAGERFGFLVVIERTESADGRYWHCRCDCGNTREAKGTRLRSGKIVSCEACGKVRSQMATMTHGLTNSSEYTIWKSMIHRCIRPGHRAFRHYGGRGIKVCDRWLKFENFIADIVAEIGMRPSTKHSLDRVNNEGNYEPGNVKWSTQFEQMSNMRRNLLLTHQGETLTLSQWARKKNMKVVSLKGRLRRGWSVEEAFETPLYTTDAWTRRKAKLSATQQVSS